MTAPRPTLTRKKKLAFGLAVAIFFFLALEGILRLVLGPPPPPVEVYNAYGAEGAWFEEQQGLVRARFVRQDPPAPFPASTDGPRCAVLGGSSVHGGSPEIGGAGEFPGLLQQELGFPVVNLGSPGLDSFDHSAMMDELLRYRWSCLVLYGGHNDFGNAYFLARYGDVASGLAARAQAGLERLHLFVQLHRLLSRPEVATARLAGMPTSTEGFMDQERWWATLRYFEANTRQMAWKARRAGVPMLIVSPASDLLGTPTQGFCTGPGCAIEIHQEAMSVRASDPDKAAALLRRARDLDRLPLRAPGAAQDALRQIAEENGLIFVDAEALLPQESGLAVPARSLFRDAVHFTAEGHQAMAELLAPYLTEVVGASR